MTKRNPMQALAVLAIPAALLLLSVPAQADPFQGGDAGQSFGSSPQSGRHFQQEGPNQQGGQMQGQDRHEQMMQQLGLSPEQRQKIKAIMQQGRTESQALHQQLKAKRQALMQYLQSSDANETRARSLNAEINDIQRQLSELRLKTWFAMRSLMTPEQIQKLGQMKSQFRGGSGGRRFGGPDNQRQGGPSGMMPRQDRMIGSFHPQQGQYGPGPGNGLSPDNNDEGSDPNL